MALASTLARSFRGRIIGTQHRRPPTVRAPSPSHARAPLIALQHNSLLHQPAVRGASHANHQLSRNFVAKPQATIVLILFARAADYYSHMAELRDAISNAERHPLQSAVRAHPSPTAFFLFKFFCRPSAAATRLSATRLHPSAPSRPMASCSMPPRSPSTASASHDRRALLHSSG